MPFTCRNSWLITDQTSKVRVCEQVRYLPPFIQQYEDERSTAQDVYEPTTLDHAYQTVACQPTQGAGVARMPTVTFVVPDENSRKTGF